MTVVNWIMDYQLFDVRAQDWVLLLAITVVVSLLLKGVVHLISRRLRRKTEWIQGGTDISDMVGESLRRTTSLFLVAVALATAIRVVDLSVPVEAALATAVFLIVLVQVGLWGIHLISAGLTHYRSRPDVDATNITGMTALAFTGKLVLWVSLVLIALDNFGVEITALIAGLGIGGIAVALAVQNILGDLFASLSIVLDKPFEIGDFLIIGDHLGTVEYIGMKTTRIRSLSGEQLVFSNSDLINRPLRNFKRMEERRVLFTFSVVYQTPADQLAAIPRMVREIIEAEEMTRFDRTHFKEYGDSGLVFEVVYYVLEPDYNKYMDIQHGINIDLYTEFERRGISFAYPTRTLYLKQEETLVGDSESAEA